MQINIMSISGILFALWLGWTGRIEWWMFAALALPMAVNVWMTPKVRVVASGDTRRIRDISQVLNALEPDHGPILSKLIKMRAMGKRMRGFEEPKKKKKRRVQPFKASKRIRKRGGLS